MSTLTVKCPLRYNTPTPFLLGPGGSIMVGRGPLYLFTKHGSISVLRVILDSTVLHPLASSISVPPVPMLAEQLLVQTSILQRLLVCMRSHRSSIVQTAYPWLALELTLIRDLILLFGLIEQRQNEVGHLICGCGVFKLSLNQKGVIVCRVKSWHGGSRIRMHRLSLILILCLLHPSNLLSRLLRRNKLK